MINRIIEPTSGRIWIEGTDALTTPPHVLRRGIGYVIQQVGLFPHRTVGENIATVPELLGWEEGAVKRRVAELAKLVGLDPELLGRYPAQLSGGQQQRVGVARALAADPPVLLMDEPFAAVDPIVRQRLQEELVSLQRRLRKTIVFVTHDLDEAILLADRMAVLNLGGKIEQLGTPAEILANPATPFVESFLGRERGLRRLSLLTVEEIDLEKGPVVGPGDGPSAAGQAMDRYGTDWVVVVEDGRLLGWKWGADLADEPHGFRASVAPSDTLRRALDVILTSHTQVAVVEEGGRYLGIIDAAAIGRALAA
jgi:osmoprotectant transport system ATP-binding protein